MFTVIPLHIPILFRNGTYLGIYMDLTKCINSCWLCFGELVRHKSDSTSLLGWTKQRF